MQKANRKELTAAVAQEEAVIEQAAAAGELDWESIEEPWNKQALEKLTPKDTELRYPPPPYPPPLYDAKCPCVHVHKALFKNSFFLSQYVNNVNTSNIRGISKFNVFYFTT